MSRAAFPILVVTLALIGGTAGLLQTFKQRQHLSEPGVMIAPTPMLDEDGNAASSHSVRLPEAVPGYESKAMPVAKVVFETLPRDTVFGHRQYRATNGFVIDCNVVLMGADRTSIHQPQYCLTGAGWRIESERTVTVEVATMPPYPLPVRRLVARGRFRGRDGGVMELTGVYAYWFVADGAVTAAHGDRMWRQAWEQLKTGRVQRWAYISCFSICAAGEEEATGKRIEEFIAHAAPEIQKRPR